MISGVIPVLYSFYDAAGALDLGLHERQLDWVMSREAAGVTVLGLASEGAALTQDERQAVVARTAQRLPADAAMLVTVRPDDDACEIARVALRARRAVGLIIQIGADPAPSLRQIARIAEDAAFAGSVAVGLQLARGLIDTDFSAASLEAYPDLLRRLSFVKAEYNSLELDAHLRALGKPLDLLVGRHGQNLIDYLRIGAVGVIPGTEMTVALGAIIADWTAGRRDAALARYGVVAPYVDFAMQDLDAVIDVGRAVTARVLGIEAGPRRRPSGRDAAALRRAVDLWFPYWRTHIARED
jgi:4-hydroxy-tetrahydrodipicolinate synthase